LRFSGKSHVESFAKMQLTAQQQAVVNHNYGPALVFAVAGAGKTTALEQRIARLVREGIFAPQRILAAAYNVAVKQELATRLQAYAGGNEVAVMTLHALGLRAVRMAWRAGLLPHLNAESFEQMGNAQEMLLTATLGEARRSKVSYQRELDNFDREDFFTWLSACKGNLFYPTLEEVPLVLRQTDKVQQAAAPAQTPWYLPFSQLMASVQQAHGLLTFDDQLRLGWEVLASHPALLAQLQQSFDCVLVDEFQDVNLAQYLILELITAPHRNYMVVGDDDQTIYEWRGANPHFILKFAEAYKAQRYLISENFRCPIGPLVLANAVIRNNRQRHVKRLRLTQGLGGATEILHTPSRQAMGQAIVAKVRSLLAQGDRLQDIAVLVRAKAQTPPVEMALIQAEIAYEVVGGQPFYARWEVQTFIDYCRLALYELQLQKGKQLSLGETTQLLESWEQLYRHPKRYISQSDARQIGDELGRGRAPITTLLEQIVIADKPWVQARLTELSELIKWLSSAFAGGSRANATAHSILLELDKRLGYCDYLEKRSARSESGVDEAENVKQFIEDAQGRGNLRDYLVYLKRLGEEQVAQQAAAGRNLLTLRTIHSAKGLEWPVVILPSCDDGNVPHRKSDNAEEERRLLYVALTRTRRDLYIYHLAPNPSSFLGQAKSATVLKAVAQICSALAKSPSRWNLNELRAVAVALPQLGLLEYLQQWHGWSPGQQSAVAQTVCAFFQRVEAEGLTRYLQLSDKLIGGWQALLPPDVASAPVVYLAIEGFDTWIEAQKKLQAQRSSTDTSPAKAPIARGARPLQAFEVVRHVRYGKGRIISSTTTQRGREVKVQFEDGSFYSFRDDDSTLARVGQ
jgi:DNA helicase-2/ATP-dependent DNA helicase PcrA